MKRSMALLGGFAALIAAATWLAAQVFATVSERQVTYRYISEALSPQTSRESAVTWQSPAGPLARPFTRADADAIGQALTDAWQALTVAQWSGRSDILSDSFSGVALDRALMSVADAQAHGGRIAVLSQSARPVFFHLDGSVFQAEVSTIVVRYIDDAFGLPVYEATEDVGVVTLMNETTGWRVFAFERLQAELLDGRGPGWRAEALQGVNYYPAETPWRQFWSEFDPERISADFDLVRSLGGNAIRVFLTHDDFNAPERRDRALADLGVLLNLAEARGLRVVPTLFDLRPGYGPGTWAQDVGYLRRVLPVLEASPAVTFVDLKNEPDLDFDTYGRADVEAWLRGMIAVARHEAPELALTVGWSSAEAAPILAESLDVVTYHDYAPREGARARLDGVRAELPGRPVVVTEIGVSSFELAMGAPGSAEAQARALNYRLQELVGADGVFIWTLYDFPDVDGSVVGGSPWVQRLQREYGLFTPDGIEKLSAAAVREHFAARR